MIVPNCIYELSDGDIANNNIRFASLPLSLDSDFIGGTNDKSPAAKSFYVFLGAAAPAMRWLYGDKKIFNDRTEITRQFFGEIGARSGTKLRIVMPRKDIIVIEKA